MLCSNLGLPNRILEADWQSYSTFNRVLPRDHRSNLRFKLHHPQGRIKCDEKRGKYWATKRLRLPLHRWINFNGRTVHQRYQRRFKGAMLKESPLPPQAQSRQINPEALDCQEPHSQHGRHHRQSTARCQQFNQLIRSL